MVVNEPLNPFAKLGISVLDPALLSVRTAEMLVSALDYPQSLWKKHLASVVCRPKLTLAKAVIDRVS